MLHEVITDIINISQYYDTELTTIGAIEYDYDLYRNIVKDIENDYDLSIKYTNNETSVSIWKRNSGTHKKLEIALYYTMKNFPIEGKAVNVVLEDGTHLYAPVDYIGADFDTGIRYNDGDSIFQVCSQLIFNIVTYKLTAANIFMQVDNISDLYPVMSYLFGKGRVSLVGDKIKFINPSPSTGIDRLLFLGLQFVITTEDNVQYTSWNQGYAESIKPSKEHDGLGYTRAMLLHLDWNRTIYISLDKDIKHSDLSGIVKNYIVLGLGVQALPNYSSTYKDVANSEAYCEYDKELGYPKNVTTLNFGGVKTDEFTLYKQMLDNYVDYKYNYYDLEPADIVNINKTKKAGVNLNNPNYDK